VGSCGLLEAAANRGDAVGCAAAGAKDLGAAV